MKPKRLLSILLAGGTIAVGATAPTLAQAPAKKPNILVIMGDDVGWCNIGAHNQDIMSVTPGVWLYQLSDEGLAADVTATCTKHFRNDELN